MLQNPCLVAFYDICSEHWADLFQPPWIHHEDGYIYFHYVTFIRSSAAFSRYCQSIHVPLFFITLSSIRDLIFASVCSSSFRLLAWFSHYDIQRHDDVMLLQQLQGWTKMDQFWLFVAPV